ncbi:MAG: MBOAT family protein [Ruminococcaceae bacterium]|nr:MBOAT family protein [Oscillospiraceae bacterium]
MLFSSISFLYYFFAAVLLLYFIVPFKFKIFKKKSGEWVYFEAKNFVLFISSFFFYFYGEPIYTILMIATTVSSYIHGLLIDRFRKTVWSKVFLWTSVITSLGALGFFKYSDFFISNVNGLFNTEFGLLGLALPIGISFYTFQTLSYTIDVYRGDAKVQKSFIRLATYVALFPQLIAGPIVRYTTIEEDLTERKHTFEGFASGATRFVIGLSKKVLIADTLGGLANSLRASDEQSVVMYWVLAIALSLQLYFDFSGYSDMAIGLGRILGFRFLENFNYPFISKSIAEFWRRWHMSLGSWFRDYLYIPLGGNRVPIGRWIFNTLVVWFATGFWHGADWTFILWGLYFALFLVLEKFFLNKFFAKIPRVFSHIYVVVLILISFVLFSGNGITGAITDIGSMFGAGGIPFWSAETGYYLGGYAFVLAAGLIGATPIVKNTVLKLKENKTCNMILNVIEPIFVVVMLLIVTAYFVDGSFSPFLYFRF